MEPKKNKEHCKFLLKETQASQSKKLDESQIKENELISKVTLKPKGLRFTKANGLIF
jgi:hypothetical protein